MEVDPNMNGNTASTATTTATSSSSLPDNNINDDGGGGSHNNRDEKEADDNDDDGTDRVDNDNNCAGDDGHAEDGSDDDDDDDDGSGNEIRRLSDETVRRLTAEQAISDLAGIVKELVDNSLDAESTTIKVRLFGQGLDIIEVSDDGCGVPASSRPYMAARHTTSKITSFDDVYTGTGMTMGFRGEALFSMACSSKELVVATRTDEEELATKLVFDRIGQLMNPTSLEHFPRKVGTTAAVVEPFMAMPARRADMARNIRRHRTKIFKLIEAYSIFNVGVCFQLIDIVQINNSSLNGPRSRGSHGSNNSSGQSREDIALNTSSSSRRLEETVSSVLGSKFLQSVTPIAIEVDSVLGQAYGENIYNWGIRGLITSALPEQEDTRTSQNRSRPKGSRSGGGGGGNLRSVQYYCVNGRVVDFPSITTLVKKLWEIHGRLRGIKSPSIILNFTLPNRSFDINIAPDKQTVVLVHEKELLELVKSKVSELWSKEVGGAFPPRDVAGADIKETPRSSSNLSAESSGEEDGDLDGERQQHKRRFAFVNDLSLAKMQHDLAARRRGSCLTTEDVRDTVPIVEEHSQAPNVIRKSMQDDRPAKRARIVGGSSSDACDVDESPDTFANSQEGVSDFERRRWIEARSKFQGSRLERETMDVKKEGGKSHPESHCESVRGVGAKSGRRFPVDIESDVSSRKLNEDSVANGAAPCSSNEKSSEGPSTFLLNLRRFAFQAKEAKSDTLPRRVSSGTSVKSKDHDNPECDTLSGSKHNAMERPFGSSSTPRTPIPARKLENDQNITPDMSPKASNSLSDPSFPTELNDNETGINSKTRTLSAKMDVDREPRRVAWESFTGTNAVCQSALRERLRQRNEKQRIDSLRGKFSSAPNEEVDSSVKGGQRLSSSVFDKMHIIGQFNLGFIVAKDPENNLWILDQHACDERIHYEDLLRNMKVQEQRLLKPLPIELSPAEEACILDYMDVFRANGFRFDFDNDAPIRHRLSLTALPHSGAQQGRNAVQFGPSDVRSLCEMLMEGSMYDAGSGGTGTDGSGMHGNNAVRRLAGGALSSRDGANCILARLPKAVAMCASRACRSSIMIGTALSKKEMEAVVRKLVDLTDPFHCAHGRPSQYPLGSLLPILHNDEKREEIHFSDPTITISPPTQEFPETTPYHE